MGKTKSRKKILIFSPYWAMLGGGERYLLQIASVLEKKHDVFLLAGKPVIKKAESVFGINLKNIRFIPLKFFEGKKFYSRYFFLQRFYACFYTTDGSLFFPGANKNYLVIQSPNHIPRINLATGFKISGWKILCYSSFMQKIIQNRINRRAVILSPAVDMSGFKFNPDLHKKEKLFITVGRFFKSDLHEKKQEFLIDFFKRNCQKYFPGWKLLICGNLTENSGLGYLRNLKKMVSGLPVEIHVNLSFSQLADFYSRSSVYWHAAGVGINSEKFPEKMEHFGITTVEAMSSGTVPVSYAAGGQMDIIENNKSGFLFHSEPEFLNLNRKLVEDKKLFSTMAIQAVKRASFFSFKNFERNVNALV